jgi:tetratricopeptide (TPR) repeat protein
MGYIEFLRKNYDKAEAYWNSAALIFPREGHSNLWDRYDIPLAQTFHNEGLKAGSRKAFDEAKKYLEKAVKYQPNVSQYWSDLGGANYELKNFDVAVQCWDNALKLDQNNISARGGYKAITGKEWGQP